MSDPSSPSQSETARTTCPRCASADITPVPPNSAESQIQWFPLRIMRAHMAAPTVMGTRRGAYVEDSPVGTTVRIADRATLETFRQDWHWHHPLDAAQMPFAGHQAQVKRVSFYHGGDELYELNGIPGIWHGQLLTGPDV